MVLICAIWAGSCLGYPAAPVADWPAVFDQDVSRHLAQLESPLAERRLAGLQGLSHLKHWPAEAAILARLADNSPQVRRAAVRALGRVGSAVAVPHLIRLMDHPSWELRQNAWLELGRLTAQLLPADDPSAWRQWWDGGAITNYEACLLTAVTNPLPALSRREALRALKSFVTPASEALLVGWLQQPDRQREERDCIAEALERIGTAKAIPALAQVRTDPAAWALGRLGGQTAEAALRQFPPTLSTLINLDRLHSTNAGPFIPYLVAQMGLVTFRSQPDDLMNAEAQPIQRVAANLIRRSGRADELIEHVLLELEYTMPRPPDQPRPPIPPEWQSMLERMRSELKPGFVREDGVTTSQPVTALHHLATDRALAPRLLPLLHHPAFVPRIYVAMTLAKLKAHEALPTLLEIIRQGYAFNDAVALASGKHFDQSQTVRWRGFLCMALGRLGSDAARAALEIFAADAGQPRDIRYGAVVGLRFIASPTSLPVLRQVAKEDIIWMVRAEARQAVAEIELTAPTESRAVR